MLLKYIINTLTDVLISIKLQFRSKFFIFHEKINRIELFFLNVLNNDNKTIKNVLSYFKTISWQYGIERIISKDYRNIIKWTEYDAIITHVLG